MKRLVIGGLTTLLLVSALAPTVNAQTETSTEASQLQPFNLVSLAYQGYFGETGVPGYAGLITGYHSGRISAEDLVQSAIDQNRIPSSALEDSAYLHSVDQQLRTLDLGTSH